MKRTMPAIIMTPSIGLVAPACMAPQQGLSNCRGSILMRKTVPRPRPPTARQSYAAVSAAAKLGWKSELRRIGAHQYRRLLHSHKIDN